MGRDGRSGRTGYGVPVRIGVVLLPEHPWREAAPLWRAADQLGLAHAWTYDHLVWGGLPDAPWHSTVATLTAAATVTERIRLGTWVSSPNFRHPLLLATDAVTVDDVSGGRLTLGLGAGGDRDSEILGARHTRAERTRRLEEFVPLLDRLLTQDHVDHAGEFFTTVDARLRPACVQQPRVPFVVAANGPRSMRLAARYGEGWVTTGAAAGPAGLGDDPSGEVVEAWWASLAEAAAQMDELEEELGRGTSGRPRLDRHLSLDSAGAPTLTSLGLAEDRLGRAEALGFTDVVVHWPRPEPPYTGHLRVLEELAARTRG